MTLKGDSEMANILDPDPPVFVDPAEPRVPKGTAEFSLRPIRPLWQQDFYGAPAWLLWLLAIAVGVIGGILVGVL